MPATLLFSKSLRSPFLKWMGAVTAGIFLIVVGITAGLGLQNVSTSGVCLANPLGRTSLWAYNPASGSLALTYYFQKGPSTSYQAQYQAAARGAFRAWARAWHVLHFVPTRAKNSADIIIRHGAFGIKGYWYDHAGLTVPEVGIFGCNLLHAEIDINDSYLVSNGVLEYPRLMLRHLLLHEIGHALGLRHVYPPIASVMIPTSAAYRYAKPQPYDVRTLAVLYPSTVAGTARLWSGTADSPPDSGNGGDPRQRPVRYVTLQSRGSAPNR